MIDLPIAPSSPPPAPAVAARPSANSSQRDTGAQQADESAFQAVLAQELEQAQEPGPVPAGLALHGLAAPAATAKAASGLKPGDDDAALTASASDTAVSPAGAGLVLFSPMLAGAVPAPPAAGAMSSSPAGLTAAGSTRPVSSLNARPAQASAAAKTQLQLLTAPTAAEAAADVAASGKLLTPAAAEGRREFAFDASLPEQQQTAPTATAAIHTGSAAPAQQHAHALAAAVNTRVGEHGWDQALGDRLVWMAGRSQQVAQLHLNPPELGPLKITLTLNSDQASAQFVSAHALVRDAIEAAMPRLREMLADSGIALGDAGVSADAFREQAQPQPQREPRAYATAAPDVAMTDAAAGTRGMQLLNLPRSLVDTFA